jgi:hypothetical protein
MIVIQPDIVLAIDEQEITDCNPRIGYDTIVLPGTVTSDQGATTRVNMANPATYLRWTADNINTQHIGANLIAARTVNYYGIAAHNLGSAGATITFEVSPDGVVWTPVTDGVLLSDDFAMIEEFPDQFAAFYRLKIENATIIPSVGVFYIGKMLRVQRRIYVGHAPFTLQRKSKVSSGFSENGQFLGRVVRSTTFETDVQVKNLTAPWVRQKLDPFLAVAADRPFFWSWRPCAYPTEVGFAWTTQDPDVSNSRPNGMMDFKMQIQGIR